MRLMLMVICKHGDEKEKAENKRKLLCKLIHFDEGGDGFLAGYEEKHRRVSCNMKANGALIANFQLKITINSSSLALSSLARTFDFNLILKRLVTGKVSP